MTGNEILMIAGMAVVTFLIRYPMLVLVGRVKLPDRVFQALRYVPIAVLTAIIVPAIVYPDGRNLDLNPFSPYFVAAVVTVLVMWRTKNLLLTILIGMAVFLLLRFLSGAMNVPAT